MTTSDVQPYAAGLMSRGKFRRIQDPRCNGNTSLDLRLVLHLEQDLAPNELSPMPQIAEPAIIAGASFPQCVKFIIDAHGFLPQIFDLAINRTSLVRNASHFICETADGLPELRN